MNGVVNNPDSTFVFVVKHQNQSEPCQMACLENTVTCSSDYRWGLDW